MINYEEDIRIDAEALDVEWLMQPSLFMKYATNAAKARRTVDEAKEKLDVTRAEIDKKIRENSEKFGIEKVTEGAISAAILTHKTFQEANAIYMQCKYEADMAQAAVNAMNQRKEALENLVKLHGMQYFAGPRVPRDLTFESQKRQKQSTVNHTIGRLRRSNREDD